MALGNLAGVARVAMEVDTGTSEQKLAAFDQRFTQTTGKLSSGAIQVELATRRLQRALSTYPADSDRVLRATLQLRSAQAAAARETESLSTHVRESGSAMQTFAHDVERAGYGVAVGSRAIKGLRSALFFSATGLAGFGLTSLLRSARDAALEQQTSLGQLQVALKDAGTAESAYAGRVKDAIDESERLGFAQADTAKSFALAVRATGSVEGATRLLSAAQNIARGTGRDLQTSTLLVTRAYEGQTGSLRRVGIEVSKGAKGYDAVRQAQARFAGSAQQYSDSAAGAQARFNVALHTTEETIGTALLPTITSLNTRLANWLDNSRNQERIQHDVNSAVKVGGEVAHDFGDAIHYAGDVIRPLNSLLGGASRTVRLLAAAFTAMKLRSIATDMGLLAAKTKVAGANAATAAGEYDALAGAEGRAAAAGTGIGAGGAPIGPFGGRIPSAGGGGITVGFGALTAIALGSFGAISDSRNGIQIPMFDASGRKVGTQYFIEARTLPKNGSIRTVGGVRYQFVRRGNRAAFVEVTSSDGSGASYAGSSPNASTTLADAGTGVSFPRGRRTSLQGQFNIAAYHLAQAGSTATTADDDKYLSQELAILDKEIAREKNLAKKTDLINQRNGVLNQLQSNRQTRMQQIADTARKRAQARQRAEQAAERSAYATVTRALEGFTTVARRLGSRGQTNREVTELKAEETYLEKHVRDLTLSAAHRQQLQTKLDAVRQRIDDLRRKAAQARAKAAAARAARPELLIQRAEAAAALTPETDDDLKAYRAEERLLNRKLAALARLRHLTNAQLQAQTSLLQQKKQVEDNIKGLVGSSGTSSLRANEDQFLSAFRDVMSKFSSNVSPAADSHLYEIKHDQRRQTRLLKSIADRSRFPAAGYAMFSAKAALG